MLNCRRATRLLSESQDRKLSLSESLLLKMHNKMCKPCSEFEKQIIDLRIFTRTYAKRDIDALDKDTKRQSS